MILDWGPHFVAEDSGLGEQVAVVDAAVRASEAVVGKGGDEGVGGGFGLVGEISDFGEVGLVEGGAWILFLLEEERGCWVSTERAYCSGLLALSLGRLMYMAATLGCCLYLLVV